MKKYVIGIIALIVLVGVYFLLRAANPSPAPATNNIPANTAMEDDKNYFRIPELGIRFELPAGLEGLQYTIRKVPADGGDVLVADLRSQTVVDKAKQLHAEQDSKFCSQGSTIGGIAKEPTFTQDEPRGYPDNAQYIDNMIVYYAGPQDACALNKDVQEVLFAQTRLMQEAAKNIESIDGSKGVPVEQGTLEGSLGYPSENIPPMFVCAENISSKHIYCTQSQYQDKKYSAGKGYKLIVPAGDYHVYASTEKNPRDPAGYRAYYDQFVTCGSSVNCKDHTPITITVKDGQTVDHIDPQDWYNRT